MYYCQRLICAIAIATFQGCTPADTAKQSSPAIFAASTCESTVLKNELTTEDKQLSLTIPNAVGIVTKSDIIRLLGAGKSTATVSVNGSAITYEGKISHSAAEETIAKLSQNTGIKRFRINSSGGSINAALRLYEVLKPLQLEIEVFGTCDSACADFIVPAARRLILDGSVKFHGTVSACIDGISSQELMRRVGFFNFFGVHRTAKREEQVWKHRPALRALSNVGAMASRGDPSGRKNDFMDVCPAALRQAGLDVSLAPSYAASHRASIFLAKSTAISALLIFHYCPN
jgi:hypothetical protein